MRIRGVRTRACRVETSYFPAQKSELLFLIEPSSIREPAARCSHWRIDELCMGDVARFKEELRELFWSLEQFSDGSWMEYSGRVARAFLGSAARGQHPADIDEVVGDDSQTHPANACPGRLYRGIDGVRGVA